MTERTSSEFSYRETEDDELQPDIYYQNLPRFKQQYNKDFKCFITDQLRPINSHGLVPIDVLVKKDKKESSKSTLKLRKEKKEKVFGAISSTEDHLTKLKPLLERIKQCNVDHEIFRRAGSKARQRRLIQKIDDEQFVNWSDVDPADATSLLKTYIAELRTPLVSVEWEKTYQLLAECNTIGSDKKVSILQAMFLCLSKSNGKLLSKLISLLNDTAQKSTADACTTSLALILWPNIQRNVSMEIETARNGTNRLRRECSIKTIKLMIEQWPNIVKPNPELSSMIQKRLLIGKATGSFLFMLPKVLRRRIDQSRSRNNTAEQQSVKGMNARTLSNRTFRQLSMNNYSVSSPSRVIASSADIVYRQKLRSGSGSSMQAQEASQLRGGDSTGCLTDGTEDEDVNTSMEMRALNTKSTSTQSFAFATYDLQPARPRSNARVAADFERERGTQRRNTIEDYYPHTVQSIAEIHAFRRRSSRTSAGSRTIYL